MFYDQLKPGDEVLADESFQMKEYLSFDYFSSAVPPAVQIKYQITFAECRKAKEIANSRTHVECAINRIQIVHITESSMTITLLQNADQIDHTSGALCNLLPFLRGESNSKD